MSDKELMNLDEIDTWLHSFKYMATSHFNIEIDRAVAFLKTARAAHEWKSKYEVRQVEVVDVIVKENEELRKGFNTQVMRSFELTKENEKLSAENFILAAGQCANATRDEFGTPQCKEIIALREQLRETYEWKEQCEEERRLARVMHTAKEVLREENKKLRHDLAKALEEAKEKHKRYVQVNNEMFAEREANRLLRIAKDELEADMKRQLLADAVDHMPNDCTLIKTEILEELKKDAARLDFVMRVGAFIQATETDAGTTAYQLWTQDEDENFIVLSGDGFFISTRNAIDAAIAAEKEQAK